MKIRLKGKLGTWVVIVSPHDTFQIYKTDPCADRLPEFKHWRKFEGTIKQKKKQAQEQFRPFYDMIVEWRKNNKPNRIEI